MTKWPIEPAQCSDTIRHLRAKMAEAEARARESALTELSALDQAAEAYAAQLAAEAQRDKLANILEQTSAAWSAYVASPTEENWQAIENLKGTPDA